MRFTNSLSKILLAIALTTMIAGCATKPERKASLPSWLDIYDRYDEDGKRKQQTETQAKPEVTPKKPASPADASDHLTKSPGKPATPEKNTVPSKPITDQPEAEPTEPIKPTIPSRKPLTAQNDIQASEAKEAAGDYRQALTFLKAGKLKKAQLLFQELSSRYPSLSGPRVNQAIILRNQGKLDQAKTVLQNALLNKTQNPYLMNELGLVNRALGKFEAARQSYLAAIRIDPNYDKAHYNLAVLADLYLHDPALAYREFEAYQALQEKPDKKVAGWMKELKRRIK